ncbi:MAG TPA: fructosamine kinase family protein [Anaerolineales bacterium]|nr:fructosamine kinase family protein [Anaerolineales bacterium]
MTVPAAVRDWCQKQGHGEILQEEPIGGGCINNGARVHTRDGAAFFLKTNASAPAEMFAREAEGLLALRTDDGPRFPEPFLWSQDFLLMEDLPPAPPGPDFWPGLGRRLAALHRHESTRFGFDHDNFIGSTPQPNPWTEDGFEFFATHRLVFQAGLAHESDRLSSSDLHRVEILAARLNELVPRQPASLLHGDLWSGNVIPGPKGEACLIDPACHFGWAEAELGMTELFGALDPSFYDAYTDARPLPAGWRDRLPVYNLYHLLNHLNLFGSSYLPSVRRVLDRFA